MKNTTGFLFQKDVKQNFTKVPNELFSMDIDPFAKLVLMYLHSKSTGFVFYRKKIAEVLGLSRQTVTRVLNHMVEKRILTPINGGYCMLIPLTSDVNPVNTVDVNLPTIDVKMPTESVAKLTRDVNPVNTNKKTLLNKTSYEEAEKKDGLNFSTGNDFLDSLTDDQKKSIFSSTDKKGYIYQIIKNNKISIDEGQHMLNMRIENWIKRNSQLEPTKETKDSSIKEAKIKTSIDTIPLNVAQSEYDGELSSPPTKRRVLGEPIGSKSFDPSDPYDLKRVGLL